MAIVLALLIIGWLVAFAVGAQAGFETPLEPAQPSVQATQPTTANPYGNSASAA
ncbi:hypothetical protein IQ256_02560 [cf. Phormidesmis sp. LEGE 11477]|nr:hypothetical protein [cf. Phormidesmis sp. LEGE 11477]